MAPLSCPLQVWAGNGSQPSHRVSSSKDRVQAVELELTAEPRQEIRTLVTWRGGNGGSRLDNQEGLPATVAARSRAGSHSLEYLM